MIESFDAERYVDAASQAVGVPVPGHCRPGVTANVARLAAMAELLITFDLPSDDNREPEA